MAIAKLEWYNRYFKILLILNITNMSLGSGNGTVAKASIQSSLKITKCNIYLRNFGNQTNSNSKDEATLVHNAWNK